MTLEDLSKVFQDYGLLALAGLFATLLTVGVVRSIQLALNVVRAGILPLPQRIFLAFMTAFALLASVGNVVYVGIEPFKSTIAHGETIHTYWPIVRMVLAFVSEGLHCGIFYDLSRVLRDRYTLKKMLLIIPIFLFLVVYSSLDRWLEIGVANMFSFFALGFAVISFLVNGTVCYQTRKEFRKTLVVLPLDNRYKIFASFEMSRGLLITIVLRLFVRTAAVATFLIGTLAANKWVIKSGELSCIGFECFCTILIPSLFLFCHKRIKSARKKRPGVDDDSGEDYLCSELDYNHVLDLRWKLSKYVPSLQRSEENSRNHLLSGNSLLTCH